MIVLSVLLAASEAATAPPPLAPLDFLAGSCFLGTFADGCVATTEKREGEGWKPFMKIVFVRKGPASDWTER